MPLEVPFLSSLGLLLLCLKKTRGIIVCMALEGPSGCFFCVTPQRAEYLVFVFFI